MARTDTVLSSKTEPITALKEFTATKPSQKAGQRLGVAIDRTGWTDQTAEVTVRMHVSLDNGKTWFQWCGLSDRGGEKKNPDGTDLVRASLLVPPPPSSALIKFDAATNGKTVSQAISLVEDVT